MWNVDLILLTWCFALLFPHCLAAAGIPPLPLLHAAYQSAIIWVFLRGVALFDATA